MGKTRKILCISIILIILVIMIIVNNVDAHTVSLSSNATEVDVGDTFTITMGFGGESFESAIGSLTYNPEIFEAIPSAEPFTVTPDEQNGIVYFAYLNQSETTSISTLQFTFKVKENSNGQTSEIKIVTDGDASEKVIFSDDESTWANIAANSSSLSVSISVKENVQIENPAPEISPGENFELKVNETKELTVVAATSVTWSSSDLNIATVEVIDGKVVVKGISKGTATITVTDEEQKTDFIEVTVIEETQQPEESAAPEITPGENFSIKVNETKELSVTAATSVTWSSSDSNIATVKESDGKVIVKGISTGTATITVTDEAQKTDSVEVTVIEEALQPEEVAAPELTPGENFTMKVNETKQLTVKASTAVIWSSSATNIATIDQNGKVTAKEAGDTIIIVTDANQKTDSLVITVIQNNEGNNSEDDQGSQNGTGTGNQNGTGTENQNGTGSGNQNSTGTGNQNGTGSGNQNSTGTGNQNGTGSGSGNQNLGFSSEETLTNGAVTQNGNSSSSANEIHPATGESSVGTIVILVIVTLIVASVVFRGKSKIK